MKNLLVVPLLALFSVSSFASDFEVSLSSKTAQFSMYSDSSVIGWGGSDLAIRFLYNEEGDYLAQAEVLSIRQASENNPLTLGVGAKFFIGSLDTIDKNVVALAVGGTVRYVVPATMPITLYASLFIAPEITSFSGSKKLSDFNLGAQLDIMPQTKMFAGMRRITVDTSNQSNYRVDDNKIHFGIRFTF